MRASFVMAWGAALAFGCSHHPPIESPTGTGQGPLRGVVLLPLTTRSVEGLLGHALHEDAVTPNRGRVVLRGASQLTETSQDVTVVRALETDAAIAADYGPAAARVSSGEVTHLAYVVHITGYVNLAPGAEYRAESDCCFNGQVHAGCAGGYVERLLRGSGSVKYLRETELEAGVGAAQLFQASTGERYRVLDEYGFDDAFFAFDRGDIEHLCETLPDAASFDPVQVVASPNCSVMAYDLQGNSTHEAKFLPDEETCRAVAWSFCERMPDCVRCVGAFSVDGDSHPFRLDVTASERVTLARRARGCGERTDAAAPAAKVAAEGDAGAPATTPPVEPVGTNAGH